LALALFSSLVLVSSCGNVFWQQQQQQRFGFPSVQPTYKLIPRPEWINSYGPVNPHPYQPIQKLRAEIDLVPAGESGVTGKIYLEQV
jgi:hypothetical protein